MNRSFRALESKLLHQKHGSLVTHAGDEGDGSVVFTGAPCDTDLDVGVLLAPAAVKDS